MSNAENMVSVPRALLMEAEASLRASGMAVTLAADIRKVLDQPAEQRQDEPVAIPAWNYCPECGSDEVGHQEGDHKQCATCHQEWFSDIDYSDVVRVHLATKYRDKDAAIDALRAQLADRDALLRDALQDCLDLELMRMLKGSVYINRLSDRIKSILG